MLIRAYTCTQHTHIHAHPHAGTHTHACIHTCTLGRTKISLSGTSSNKTNVSLFTALLLLIHPHLKPFRAAQSALSATFPAQIQSNLMANSPRMEDSLLHKAVLFLKKFIFIFMFLKFLSLGSPNGIGSNRKFQEWSGPLVVHA